MGEYKKYEEKLTEIEGKITLQLTLIRFGIIYVSCFLGLILGFIVGTLKYIPK